MKRLLLPFSWIYQSVTRFRNHLYDIGIKKSVRFDGLFTIGVGNLSMGGTGKTPATEYLIRLLKQNYKVAVLSRGYGRETKGLRLLKNTDVAETAGDEPVQLFRKFGDEIHVVVSEDRVLAIPALLNEVSHADVVILDDAFQHRRINPDLSILLTKFDAPFFKDFIFPAGWLRESRIGAKRADVVLVTKCPGTLESHEIESYSIRIKKYAGQIPVFFTRYGYQPPVPFGKAKSICANIILVTGIAHSDFLKRQCMTDYRVVRHLKFSDHHNYTILDIQRIIGYLSDHQTSLLTTEKDMIRLTRFSQHSEITDYPWFYLPVEIEFLHGGNEFNQLIKAKVEEKISSIETRE